MKYLLLTSLALCSCQGYDITMFADTPYGELQYKLPPLIEEPTK